MFLSFKKVKKENKTIYRIQPKPPLESNVFSKPSTLMAEPIPVDDLSSGTKRNNAVRKINFMNLRAILFRLTYTVF